MSAHPQEPIRLYRHALSGHCHRVELLLELMHLPYQRVEINLQQGEHKTPAFLQLNPFGLLPVIDDNGTVVADSAAILVYLARKYGGQRYLPEPPEATAAVQRWLAVAAGPLASGPAAARVATLFNKPIDTGRVQQIAHDLLQVMEDWLSTHAFLAAEHETLADLAFYAYIAHAPEGNVSLAAYPHVRQWLSRIEQLPDFVPMQRSAVGLAAVEG
ncbi:glutathione S-transferase family protein [Silvimonas iriomotensis]|uniref:Glutathione S-transferase n=1 Tax=Silvimonas iriomotensis TaxID=449662 RepID=A0ABQ2P7Q5_9NEIS|nr:glutathione S-transferase [Silvimonas iriomotensis]GGP20153.1 glutathione S-transferase [Silvimonas iriomotensis]